MRKSIAHAEKWRLTEGPLASSEELGCNGAFQIPMPGLKNPKKVGRKFWVIVSDGGGWDHVSVSLTDRCPTWFEMCFIKRIFFEDEECVVQYHPAKDDYRNLHEFCLHLWRPQGEKIPTPPPWMVAPEEAKKIT